MSIETPTVFIHSGYSTFLPYALHQARHSDPASQVFLLGDGRKINGISVRDIRDLENESTAKFRQVFRPMSPNSPEFELMCYLRWFYLANFLRREGFRDVVYFDSDVLSYGTVDELKASMIPENVECGLSLISYSTDSLEWTACGHASYWTTGILDEFCEFCIRSYTDSNYMERYQRKMAWNAENGVHGGISDMTTLFLFWSENRNRIANLAARKDDFVVDHNILLSANSENETYVIENGMKKVRLDDGKAFLFPEDGSPSVRTLSLHFQGGRKKFMSAYYTGPSFPGRRRIKFQRFLRDLLKGLLGKLRSWAS